MGSARFLSDTMGYGNDALNNDDIIVIDACFCCYEGLIFNSESCGCMASEQYCCCEGECCCKTGVDKLGCYCCALRCKGFEFKIKSEYSFFCCAGAAGFPPDGEVPMMIGTCGL